MVAKAESPAKTVSVSELRSRLPEVIARVQAGEEIVVTKRGAPVAKMSPTRRRALDDPERLRDLERRGVLRIGTGRLPKDFWEQPRPFVPGNAAVEALLADREEGL